MKTNHIDAATVARHQRHARNLAMLHRVASAPAPAAPVYERVTIWDCPTDKRWPGTVVDGIVTDASGFIDPRDIPFRFHILCDGVDVSDEFACPA